MSKIKNCCIIGGDNQVVISQTSASYALTAMTQKMEAGGYKSLFADDKSFVYTAIKELKEAVKRIEISDCKLTNVVITDLTNSSNSIRVSDIKDFTFIATVPNKKGA